MIKLNQNGAVSSLALYSVMSTVAVIVFLVFGIWAFSSRQDYKNNTDAKIAAAVTAADQKQSNKDTAEFAEQSKSPLATYDGPEVYGSIILKYPKTWSGYVDDTGNGAALVDGYFSPGVVPALTGTASVFALRVQVVAQAYPSVVAGFSAGSNGAAPTVTAYSLPKLPQVVGVEINGQFGSATSTQTMVVLPLRSETIEISTQGSQYLSDFNTYVLPNFSFSP